MIEKFNLYTRQGNEVFQKELDIDNVLYHTIEEEIEKGDLGMEEFR